jgi:hypothetical protein
MPYLSGYPTPQDYGAAGNGTNDDTTAVQAAITAVASGGTNAVGVLVFPEGTYKISSALTLGSYIELRGMGSGISVINQTSTTANGVTGTDLTNVKITGLSIDGPSSGSGIGVNLAVSVNTDVPFVVMDDVRVASFGSHGLEIQSPIASRFSRVNVTSNGGDAWHVYGTGTSCHWNSCYALSNASGIGYHLIGLSYSSLTGCAADSNADGYSLSGCYSIALNGCGTESNTTDGYILSGGAGNSLTSCYVYANNRYGVHVTNSEVNATINGFVEHSPTGSAVASVITDSGTSATINNLNKVTATSLASGTAYQTTPLTSLTPQNITVGAEAALGDNGVGEIQLANAGTVPTTNPTGGITLYASGGNGYYRNPSGFIIDLSENATTSTGLTTITGVTTIQSLAAGSTVAASTLAAGQVYRFAAWGSMTTTVDTQTFTFGLYWGGTGGTLLNTWGASNPNSSAPVTGAAWYAQFDIVANSATSLAVQGVLGMNYYYGSQTQSTTTVANSSAEQLVLAVTPSASAATITCGGFYCMRIH